MAIRRMTSEDKARNPNVETVLDYPGHEAWRISHHWDCPHYKDRTYETDTTFFDDCHDRCKACSPLYMETTYVGKVVATGEINGYQDSDFFAWVAEDDGTFKTVEYASTRGWTYPNSAWVDADDETKARFVEWQNERARKADEAARKAAEQRRRELGLHVHKGDRVRVVRGRKVEVGTEGEVFWCGPNRYNHRYRAGLNTDIGETVWVDARYLEVVG